MVKFIIIFWLFSSGCRNTGPFEEIAKREEKIKKREQGLKELEGALTDLSFWGVTLKYDAQSNDKISVDISELMTKRRTVDYFVGMSEDILIEKISKYLGIIGWLAHVHSNHGNEILPVPGFGEKEQYYSALSAWPVLAYYEYEVRTQTLHNFAKKVVMATRNIYHVCKENTDPLMLFLAHQVSRDCLSLLEELKDTTQLEITLTTSDSMDCAALRGIPLEYLSITSDHLIKLSLEGLEGAKDLRELRLKNIQVEDLSPLYNLKKMETLWMDSSLVKHCPTHTPNPALNEFCQGF